MTGKPRRFLREPVVMDRTGKSRTTIHRDVKAGTFPQPIAIGPRSKAWLESDIEAWMAEQVRVSRNDQAAAASRRSRGVKREDAAELSAA